MVALDLDRAVLDRATGSTGLFQARREFLERLFANTPEADRRKITSENAAKLFGFALN